MQGNVHERTEIEYKEVFEMKGTTLCYYLQKEPKCGLF
jgi:hypothetical protein